MGCKAGWEVGGVSCVVTGGGRGVGRGIVGRLLAGGTAVVVIERDPDAVSWVEGHAGAGRLAAVVGDAADEAVAARAADLAERVQPLTGWVNNAAVFRDASVHDAPVGEVVDLITRNLRPALVGVAVAVRRFLAAGTAGAIVNVSSHQAGRPVPGCLPYATAKAAIEGLTRALAVEYGPHGIRANAVALGSVTTERHEAFLAGQEADEVERIETEMARLHPVGRIGQPRDVAEAVAYLLSPAASFVNGVTLPVDGGRSVLGLDPESR
ncbi:SDR family NAD(P)-dependent oxidoreductase [Micromonospora sp. CA-263727]|uniref:SDR family NAD(P)-dependent oxidoreductase n=1 Tax=Micromonospora sp. CA-263727 TaxID=3239967 RepID=UPI003D8A5872